MKNLIILILILFISGAYTNAQVLKVSPQILQENSIFGKSVSTNNNWAVVTAPGYDTDLHFKCGTVFLYQFKDGEWIFHSQLFPEDPDNLKYFGYSAIIYNNRLFIGATGDYAKGPFSGAVYFYELENEKWIFKQKIISEGSATQYFGNSLTSVNNTLVVGAYLGTGKTQKSGVVYVYKYDGSKWNLSQKLFDNNGDKHQSFGFDIDMQSDGILAVGAPKADGSEKQAGAVFLYEPTLNGYSLIKKITDANGKHGNQFGHSVSIDNNRLVTGSHLSNVESVMPGKVFVFKKSNSEWELQSSFSNCYNDKDYFGYDVSISGNYLLVGAPNYNVGDIKNVGSAFLFEYENNQWKEIIDINLAGENSNDFFGSALFIDSLNLVIGARLNGVDDKGAAYISKLNTITSADEFVPHKFALEQNFPNPFNPTTRILYSIKEATHTKLIVYDILGREVTTLVNSRKEPGNYFIDFDASNITSGVYFYKIKAGSFVDIRKMVLLK